MHTHILKNSLITIGIIVLLRLLTLGTSSLIDTTEGRYASISQEMALSNDWVTPRIYMESGLEPYKGKPPFHFWISALSLKLFGMNEVAARLPTFLGGVLTLCMTFYFALLYFGLEIALLSALILVSSGQFFLLWGAVHLDFTLTFSVSGMLIAWFFATSPHDSIKQRYTNVCGISIFIFAAIGMLTKGPISIVLACLPILIWSFLRGELRKAFSIPWISGSVIFLLCVAPWFYYAELASPGFIKYFFINENFLRYVSKEYGDKYGVGHTAPHGASLLMLLQGMLPWSLSFLFLIKKRAVPLERLREWLKSVNGFVFLWGITPALFFTLSKQILPAYMLPGFGGFSIFIASLLISEWQGEGRRYIEKGCFWISRLFPYFSCLLAPIGLLFFNATITQALSCFSVSLLAVFYMRSSTTKTKQNLINSVALTALSLSLIFSALLTAGGTYIGMRRSTGEIIREIREKKPNEAFSLGLIIGRNFSAQFYDNASTTQPITLIRISPDNIVASNIPDFIIEKSQLNTLPAEVFNTYTEQERFIKWVWFSKNE